MRARVALLALASLSAACGDPEPADPRQAALAAVKSAQRMRSMACIPVTPSPSKRSSSRRERISASCPSYRSSAE